MSKKTSRSQNRPNAGKSQTKRRRKSGTIIGLILSLGLVGTIVGGWRSMRSLPTTPMPQASPTPQLSKEYIYAGGRLIATEEPLALSAPSSLVATGTSASQVNVEWTASASGSVDHYQIERMHSMSSGYSVIASSVTTTSYSDSSVSAGAAYLYRVRAFDSSNNYTGYSNVDLATAISFTDDPIAVDSTPIRAQHVTELRLAINAVRTLANLSATSWTNSVQAGLQIRALDVQEMRTSIDQGRSTLGLGTTSYSDQPLSADTTRIRKNHFDELRQSVK